MIGEMGAHLHFANAKLHFLKLFDRQMTWQFPQANGKKRRFHLPRKDCRQTGTSALITQHPDDIFFVVGRREKGQALDVVPVRVRNQKSQFDRLRCEFLLESEPECTNPGASIENNDLTVGPYFDTAGIASVTNGRWSWHWNGTAHSPKLEARRDRV